MWQDFPAKTPGRERLGTRRERHGDAPRQARQAVESRGDGCRSDVVARVTADRTSARPTLPGSRERTPAERKQTLSGCGTV